MLAGAFGAREIVMPGEQLGFLMLGTGFVLFGVAALVVAAIRERIEVRILVWLGLWSVLYGVSLLGSSPAVVAALPHAIQVSVPFVRNAARYLLLVMALLAWSELTRCAIRRFTLILVIPALAVAAAGIGMYVATGSGDAVNPYNNALAGFASFVLTAVVLVPRLSARFMTSRSRVFTVGASAFAVNAMLQNISGAIGRPLLHWPLLDHLVFAGFLLSFAYVAARQIFVKERRLLALESELEIARRIQSSILPVGVPEIRHLEIAARYQPMTAIGGDFYEFVPVDEDRVGFLVADVSGHGVPAALIASMIKIGMQSTASCADEPGEVLRRLNRILAGQLRGVLVSAGYLWIDMKSGKARYAAAGHPPLLCWRAGQLERIESNGLLFGVLPDTEYPSREWEIGAGDLFLLYTDGVTEPENAEGEAFGERRLEQVLTDCRTLGSQELVEHLLEELRRWQPPGTEQQDDITVVVTHVAGRIQRQEAALASGDHHWHKAHA